MFIAWDTRKTVASEFISFPFDIITNRNLHSPTAMVRLCFALLLLRKEQDGIHVPHGFMDNLEGEVADKKFHEGGFWEDILSADLNREDALLPNIA